MVTVYLTSYVSKLNKKKHELEHEIGLSLLRKGLEELYGIRLDASRLQETLRTEEHGKPYLYGREEIHFNISHCNGLVACAFSKEPVGIDVEEIQDFKESLPKRILTQREQELLNGYRQEEQKYKECFFRFWTLKESYIKWDGRGFVKEPRDISFELDLTKDPVGIAFSDKEGRCKYSPKFYQEKVKEKYLLAVCSKQLSEYKNININFIKEDF